MSDAISKANSHAAQNAAINSSAAGSVSLASGANAQVQSDNAKVQKSGNDYDSTTKSMVASAANAAAKANADAETASSAAQSYVNQAKSASDAATASGFRDQASSAASVASSAASLANSIASSVYDYLYGNNDYAYGYVANSISTTNSNDSDDEVDGYTKVQGIQTPFKIYVKQSLFEHSSPNFNEDNEIREHNRSDFIFDANELEVVAVYRGKNGLLRFKLKNGRYVTANSKYVGRLYLNDHKITKLYVINPGGIWEHSSMNFNKDNRVNKLSDHREIKVQGVFIGKDGITRFVLENGNFITGNVEDVSTKDFTKNEKW